MKRVAIIVHRYSKTLGSGAEDLARQYALRLKEKYQVEILTTTCLDADSWANALDAGVSEEDGLIIRRFPTVHGRIHDEFSKLTNIQADRIARKEPTENIDDQRWIETQGPVCPSLLEYLNDNRDEYSAFLFMTYLYYTTVRGLPLVANKAIFIPTAHDEIWIRQGIFEDIFSMPAAFGFLTQVEETFVRCQFHNSYIPGMIVGCGIDKPQDTCADSFREKFGLKGDYVVYVGRVDQNKKCDEMIRYFIQYKKAHPSNLKLVLIGRGVIDIPKRDDIVTTGFVSEQEKWDGITGAKVMIAPSPAESLCIALLEGLAAGTPALVNGECAVLEAHCLQGQCGYVYRSEREFEEKLHGLLTNEDAHDEMSENAVSYVKENYGWDSVVEKLHSLIHFVESGGRGMLMQPDVRRSTVGKDRRDILSDNQERSVLIEAMSDTAIEPAFDRNDVSAVFVASDTFTSYVGVLIQSIIENASADRNYDLLVMETDISVNHMNQLTDLAKDHENISVRFIDVNRLVKAEELIITGKNYNYFTYYRLLIPHVMRKYQKVLYLDADVLANADIAELYDLDISGYNMAGTYDITVTSWQSYRNEMSRYFRSIGLTKPGEYMQAGVILFNIEEMNRNFTPRFLIDKACTETFMLNDQDLLNVYSKGKIKYFGLEWNVFVLYDGTRQVNEEHLPPRFYEEYTRARRNPKIIHYTEKQFPDRVPDADMAEYYWKYAKHTPFYERMLQRLY